MNIIKIQAGDVVIARKGFKALYYGKNIEHSNLSQDNKTYEIEDVDYDNSRIIMSNEGLSEEIYFDKKTYFWDGMRTRAYNENY